MMEQNFRFIRINNMQNGIGKSKLFLDRTTDLKEQNFRFIRLFESTKCKTRLVKSTLYSGIEPLTSRLTVSRSTNWANRDDFCLQASHCKLWSLHISSHHFSVCAYHTIRRMESWHVPFTFHCSAIKVWIYCVTWELHYKMLSREVPGRYSAK